MAQSPRTIPESLRHFAIFPQQPDPATPHERWREKVAAVIYRSTPIATIKPTGVRNRRASVSLGNFRLRRISLDHIFGIKLNLFNGFGILYRHFVQYSQNEPFTGWWSDS